MTTPFEALLWLSGGFLVTSLIALCHADAILKKFQRDVRLFQVNVDLFQEDLKDLRDELEVFRQKLRAHPVLCAKHSQVYRN